MFAMINEFIRIDKPVKRTYMQ